MTDKPKKRQRQQRKEKYVLDQVDSAKNMAGIVGNPSYKKIRSAVEVNEGGKVIVDHGLVQKQRDGSQKYTSGGQLVQLLNDVSKITADKNVQSMQSLVGLKFMRSVEDRYLNATQEQKKAFLHLALADDIGGMALGALKVAAPHVTDYLWGKVKNSKTYSKIKGWLNDTLGIDMNDGPQQGFNYNPSDNLRSIDWQTMDPAYANTSECFNGVAVQAISSILCPEFTSCRIPSDSSNKTSLYARTFSTVVSTNSSGNAIFVIYPNRVFADGSDYQNSYYNIYNGADLDLNNGSQTAYASFYPGPLTNYGSQASQYRVTATSINIQCIQSSLQNSGRVIGTMYNSSYPGTAGSAPVGLSTIKDREFQTYTAMNQINGHRFVYIPNDLVPGSFITVNVSAGNTGTGSPDGIQLFVSGSAASVAAIQVTINFTVELITINSLGDIGYPPIGPATQMALKEILRIPRIRILGNEEAIQLFEALALCQATYESVMYVVRNARFNHGKHDFVGYGQGGQLAQNQSSQNFYQGMEVATM